MIRENTLQEFLTVLSSKAPVPGGGGASAVGGAVGAALGQMVINLTVGKKRYADVEEEMRVLLDRMEELKGRLLDLADQDAEVFAPLAAAYSLPSQTEEEKAQKEQVMEERLLAASQVPLEIMETSFQALDILEVLAAKGSRMAVSDVGVGVSLIRAALLGAVMNVYINTKSMKNREKADELNGQADRLIAEGTKKADRIYEDVLRALR